MLGVTMRKERTFQNIALHRARRQPRGRSHALDVKDHTGDFGIISQPYKLCHEGNPGPGSRRHGTRPSPARAQNHADRGQFVFRLHNGKCGFTVGTDSVVFQVISELLDQRCGRRYRIPGHYRHAGKHATQRRGSVAVNNDLALVLVHGLDEERVLLGKGCLRVVVAGPHRAHVEIGSLLFLGKLLGHRLLGLFDLNAEQGVHHAHIGHVLDQAAQLGFRTYLSYQLVIWDGIKGDVLTQAGKVQRFVVNARRARHE